MHRGLRIGIVGAGPGGLTLAHCLLKKGFKNVKLFERAPSLLEVGAGFSITGGREIIKYLGLEPKFETIAHPLTLFQMESKDLKKIVIQIKVDKDIAPRGVSRAAFVDMLVRELPSGVLSLNKGFSSYVYRNDKVDVNFHDGTAEELDLLIGADGIKSKIREQLFQGAYKPVYAGHAIWFCITKPNVLNQLDKPEAHTMRQIMGDGTLLGYYPTTENRILFWYVHPSKEAPQESWEVSGAKEQLIRETAKENPPENFIKSLDQVERIIHLGLYNHQNLKVQPWYKGNVALLGDACHTFTPHLGQGANQAMEDAMCLARLLSTYNNLPEALQAYEKTRRPKVAKLVEASTGMGKFDLSQSNTVRFIRDRIVFPLLWKTNAMSVMATAAWKKAMNDAKMETL